MSSTASLQKPERDSRRPHESTLAAAGGATEEIWERAGGRARAAESKPGPRGRIGQRNIEEGRSDFRNVFRPHAPHTVAGWNFSRSAPNLLGAAQA